MMSRGTAPLVLAVDDEGGVLRLVKFELEAQGFRVLTAGGAEEAITEFETHRPDIVVLDLGLPDMDGFELLRRLREYRNVPVVMLTAKSSDAEKIRGLQVGADDYLVKPFNPDELGARIDAVLRRAEGQAAGTPPVRVAGDVTIDLERRLVFHGDDNIALTRTEWMLLQYLARNPGKVLLSRELLTKVWGPEYRDDLQYLRVWVSRLRQKIEPDPANPQTILTRPGIGYLLKALE